MKLNEVITRAYKEKWDYTNQFSIDINQGAGSSLSSLAFITKGQDLAMHVVNVDIPDLQAEQIEAWQVDRYRVQLGPDQVYRFGIQFADSNDLELWRSFAQGYQKTRDDYFDRCKMEIQIYKEPDYDPDGQRVHLITFEEQIIESVGKIPFSNESEPEIIKFNVQFKQTKFSID